MNIRRIAWLGDSLSDSDEFWNLGQQVLKVPLPNQKWYAGQFSNGDVHADSVPGLLGLQGGEALNYAFAGARAVGRLQARNFIEDPSILKVSRSDPLLDTDINLTAQKDRLLADAAAGRWDLGEVSVNVWIGANDLSNWEPSSIWPWRWSGEIDALVRDVVSAVKANVADLLAHGVGEVRIATLPETTFFPVFNDAGFLTDTLSRGVVDDLNGRLEAMVDGFAASGSDVFLLDIHAVTDEIEADAGTFGFTELEKPILVGANTDYDQKLNPDLGSGFDFARDAGRIGFIDAVHPSAALHGVLAAFEAEAMRNPLVVRGREDNTVTGGNGAEIILAGGGDDVVDAGGGQDVVLGGEGQDRITGGSGSDILAGGSGSDVLDGGNHHDLLAAGWGNDRLKGGSGDDVLISMLGDDTLRGQEGDDWLFWFDPGLLGRGPDAGTDLLTGGRGMDTAVFCLADTAGYDAAVAEYASLGGRNFVLETVGLEGRSIEAVRFVDLSDRAFDLPETGNG